MDESKTTWGTPAASMAATIVLVRRLLSARTWVELKFGGRSTYAPSVSLNARLSAALSSTSAMETSAPASFHTCPLATSRTTTRTFLFCERTVSATTLPVFPEAPSTTNTGEPPSFPRLRVASSNVRHSPIICPMDMVHKVHERRASWFVRPKPARSTRRAADRTERDASFRPHRYHPERCEPRVGAT